MNTWNSPHLLSISWEMARVLLGGLEGTGATLGPASTPGCSSSCEDVDPKTNPSFSPLRVQNEAFDVVPVELRVLGARWWRCPALCSGGQEGAALAERQWPSRRLHAHQPFYCVDLQFLLEKRKLILK